MLKVTSKLVLVLVLSAVGTITGVAAKSTRADRIWVLEAPLGTPCSGKGRVGWDSKAGQPAYCRDDKALWSALRPE